MKRESLTHLLRSLPSHKRFAIEREMEKQGVPLKGMSTLEAKFAELWKRLEGPELEREVRFSERRFRFDFLHRQSKIAIEIDGSTFAGVRGGHTSGKGYAAGCEKGNLAIMMGYRMFRLTSSMIDIQSVASIMHLCQEKHA